MPEITVKDWTIKLDEQPEILHEGQPLGVACDFRDVPDVIKGVEMLKGLRIIPDNVANHMLRGLRHHMESKIKRDLRSPL